MQNQRIGVHQLNRFAALIHRKAIVELHRTDIGQQQHIGRQIAHAKSLAEFRMLDRRARAAHAHGHTHLLRRRRKIAVDPPRLLGAAGHR